MGIMKLYRMRALIVRIVIVPLVSFLLCTSNAASQGADVTIRVDNPKCTVVGNLLMITYNLVAPASSEYRVHIVMLRAKDPSFRFAPQAVKGDVGDGVSSGPDKEIIWEFRKDFPNGLPADDYSCEFYVEKISTASWIYYAAGTAVAGIAALLLLTKGKSQSADGGPSLPSPPTRP